MTRRRASIAILAVATLGLLPATAAQAAAPVWRLTTSSQPSNLVPGAAEQEYVLVATNVGSAPAGAFTITDTLPAGITPLEAKTGSDVNTPDPSCGISGQTVECTDPGPLDPTRHVTVSVFLEVSAPHNSTVTNVATVAGGGAAEAFTDEAQTTVSGTPAPFGLLDGSNGLGVSLTAADGSAATQAGSHPGQLTVDLGFNDFDAGERGIGLTRFFGAGGGVRDVGAVLPPGVVVNPQATPVHCTEADLETDSLGCPAQSQVGRFGLLTTLFGGGLFEQFVTPIYNMNPPRGTPASFGVNVAGVSVYIHLIGGLRAGDYALTSVTNDILARSFEPVDGTQVQLWGDPSSPIYDPVRGNHCNGGAIGICPEPVDPQSTPLLTMPTSCVGSLTMEIEADSWEDPGDFVSRSAPFTDPLGNPTGVTGCEALEFEPTLKARPTTSVADSPSGLEVDLHIPREESVGALAQAHLKEAKVVLPNGLTINPSSANGLGGCTSAQIGIDSGTGKANGEAPTCPDASKLGTVEVDTPLLENPLAGSVYLATPHDNPFNSLLAIYLVVDDPQTGTLIKLAGHVEADPQTGRLTTTFSNSPQLPFEDFKLNFFGGAGGALRTPATCGTYQTTSALTPWSANPPATPHDEYEISQAPGGGSCPTSSGTEPNAPSFDAGTISPIAGAYSPMVVNLRRNDGSQEFSSVTLTPPPGLLGKLAGIPYCPESALKAAEQKSGTQEKANPSCPAASKVGTVTVGAGAGPAPYYTTGNAYLTPPYKGAPLSLAIVTPATAGPYDLGTVVVRTALQVNSETAQITGVSDPIPHILQGIPLDIRSVQVKLDRNQFTLNGTSCNPFAFTGTELSVLGQSSSLSSRFQLGECAPLPFKPKLSFRLRGKTNRGGDPAFSATLTMPPGSANIAAAKVALPKSEFLDNAHIGTVCTRVQFAEGGGHGANCPAASVYGFAKATSPLLDQPLEGPVFLRSSDHELPDLVASLRGQISVDLDGRVDSINGGIRNSFEIVPDAPVTSFTLEMAGGSKGLLENSTNICRGTHRATVEFTAQNGKVSDLQPALKNSKCAHAKKHKRRHRAKRHQRHAVR